MSAAKAASTEITMYNHHQSPAQTPSPLSMGSSPLGAPAGSAVPLGDVPGAGAGAVPLGAPPVGDAVPLGDVPGAGVHPAGNAPGAGGPPTAPAGGDAVAALADKLGKALTKPMKRPAAAATAKAKAKQTAAAPAPTGKAKAKAKAKAKQTAPKAKQTAPQGKGKPKRKFPFMLGCGKCRGAVNGCAQCRNPKFGGKRFRGTGKK
eukprot:2338391-Pyramimonas_sp.AAC.2